MRDKEKHKLPVLDVGCLYKYTETWPTYLYGSAALTSFTHCLYKDAVFMLLQADFSENIYGEWIYKCKILFDGKVFFTNFTCANLYNSILVKIS